MVYDEFLKSLNNSEDSILWPNTPISTPLIQNKIKKLRGGIGDKEKNHKNSRTYKILNILKNIEFNNFLDIACGDGWIIGAIKEKYKDKSIYGLDINVNNFDSHLIIQEEGVKLISGSIQHLFSRLDSPIFDCVMMLNTYRSWNHAQLSAKDKNLPLMADKWFNKCTKNLIITSTLAKIDNLNKGKNWMIKDYGKLEDNDHLLWLKNTLL